MAATEDPRGAARIATISALIVVASFIAGKAARDAILLARFDVRMLPIFTAISAVISLPIILLAGRLMARFGPARLMPALNAVSAALAIGEWLLLQRYPRPVAVAVYFHLATSGAVLVSGFWSIVNERFDVQAAKRHIAQIGVGATLGGILGGVIAERAAVYLARDAIVPVLAGLQLACAVALRRFARQVRREPSPIRSAGTWPALRVVAASPLLRGLGGLVVLGAIAAAAMDYVFKADMVAAAGGSLLRSLAIFYTITSIITAVFQAVVCGPLIARLGVPRSIATLPVAVTAFGMVALALPVPAAAAIARGAEAVTRNSVYRSGYELSYAPLPEDEKRPAKVVLDVGAERIGDLLGAQLVGLLVYSMAQPRFGLLVAAVCTGALAVALAMRLPRSYTMALEGSLLARAPDPPVAPRDGRRWITLSGLPILGQAGELAPLALRIRGSRQRSLRARSAAARPSDPDPGRRAPSGDRSRDPAVDPVGNPVVDPAGDPVGDPVVAAIAELRSGDPARIQCALGAGLTPELAPHVVDLVGRDEVARAALGALGAVAARCTGMLIDALLDPRRDVAVRRRLPAALLAGEPQLAAWGLWRALDDPSFDVRYRAGAVLARLAADGHLRGVSTEDVFAAVRRELLADRDALADHRVIDDLAATDEPRADPEAQLRRVGTGLEHVFTVLGLALPAEPLRIALHAVQTDDAELRGTALEYLESVLPTDVRAQLWPLLEGEGPAPGAATPGEALATPVSPPAPRTPRSHDEILAALHLSYPTILEKLRQRAKPAKPA